MYDLQKIAALCLDEVKAAGITPGDIFEFVRNDRLSSTFGKTRGFRRGLFRTFKIEIAGFLLDDACPLEELKDTICHEILHTCDGGIGHNAMWQRYARIMNRKYGYHISTHAEAQTVAKIAPALKKVNPPKYITTCTKCGYTEHTYRMCGFIRHPSLYLCPVCRSSDWKRIQ